MPASTVDGLAALAGLFPADFRWGAASSAFQIEGSPEEDGRGESVWDVFCRGPGQIAGGHDARQACGSYLRWEEDLTCLRQLQLGSYRFSVAWPRILPAGTGAVNHAGLDHYDRVVDALLGAGIEPWLTLYHWDLPQALEDRGGWLHPDMAGWFADYAAVVAGRLGDRVRHWITLNEPQCFIGLGYGDGSHAPGRRLPRRELLAAARQAHLAHARGLAALRSSCRLTPQAGLAIAAAHCVPATEDPADLEAARQASFDLADGSLWKTPWWLDPVLRGRLPEDGLRVFGRDVPKYSEADWRDLAAASDFLGLNIYSAEVVRASPRGPEVMPRPPGSPANRFDWPVVPACLHYGPRWFHERYGLPVPVTENGFSGLDWPDADGVVADPQRIDYLRRHLHALGEAVAAGTPVPGYWHWTLLDNFEWAEGYRQRFGLVHVDFTTGRRTPKQSAHWLRELIGTHRRHHRLPV